MLRYRSFVWFCWFLLVLPAPSRTLELHELFPFGPGAGDRRLESGTDRTEELRLNGTVLLFRDSSDLVHINTNGFVSFVAPPPEDEYLGKMPAGFKLMAALLGDLDDGGGQGGVYFREDSSRAVRQRATEHVKAAFPRDEDVEPDSVLIVTWDKMVAAGTADGVDSSSTQRNTFQLVVAFSASSSYAVLLYPRDGLQFLSTSVGGERKLLEVGFNEGLVQGWFVSSQGTYFRATTDEEASITELTEKTNSGQRGIWVYEIGASPYFFAITPGMVSDLPEDKVPLVTMLPRQPDEPQVVDLSENPDEAQTTSTEAGPEPVLPTESPINSGRDAESFTTGIVTSEQERPQLRLEQFNSEHPEPQTPAQAYTDSDQGLQTYPESRHLDRPESRHPDRPESRHPDRPESRHPDRPESRHPDRPESRNIIPEAIEPRYSPDEPRYPDPEESQYNNPEPIQPVPPHSHPEHPHIVVVDGDLDVNVFSYNSGTCANNRHKCSAFADCRDHSNGFCCHCRPGFYGNGKDCVAEGKPQRMNGKVSGRVFVGDSSSPVEFSNKDLHSYVVANDGRAYVAISNIPKSWGPSLQPLSSLGGVIGWAFALEQPGHHNGFSIVGGVFSRQAEVVFQPGNERLSIRQEFRGIDEHDHLVVSTELEGQLPAVPLGASVHINPYKEIYHYDQNLITSSSNREYAITFPDGEVQTRSYQWRQTITFQSCVHDEASRVVASTQQLTVDQVFVMFDPDNDLIRYAMSNKIGSVHSVVPEQNPCFTGRHGCDLNAVCRPADGLQFSCKCAAGFTGDGRYCHDIDECLETPEVCGSNAICSNQPGSFHCECSAGYVFASDGRTCIEDGRPVDHCRKGTHVCDVAERAVCSYSGGSDYVCSCLPGFVGDGRVCQDVDECQEDRCHRDAVCSNTQGSFTCHCRPGFHGDGVQCSVTPSEHEKTPCERQRDAAQSTTTTSIFSLWFQPTAPYIPQCDAHGSFESTQCHSAIGQCWCADADGREIPNTRTGAANAPLCINQAVTLPPVGPTPRPDVDPAPPGTNLLFAQSGRIERVPLDGHLMRTEDAKPLLHIPDRVVIAVAYDCVDEMVYWSDITAPAISRARMSGGDVVPLITKELQSPEGLAVDHVSRLLFWTDSVRDTVEVSQLDGSHRRVLFDTDLVNPRPIVTNPVYGRLFWADWDRDGPKIEMSNMDGTDRSVLVKDDLGLPNGLTFDLQQQQLCWADAGTRRLECIDPQRRLRRRIVEQIQYPFAVVAVGQNLFYTDWRREAVVAVDRHSAAETEEFLPQKRSRLYGITTASALCPQVYNYCANNGGCSHLCLPRAGGFSCRCPDVDAAAGRCVEMNL